MGAIEFKQKGDFKATASFLEKAKLSVHMLTLDKYGKMGVEALSKATPIKTGLTADSWYYEIEKTNDGTMISWHNSNTSKGYFNIALMLQYGHGTKNGGYVVGTDYINPAIRPVFDKLAKDAWEEVTR